MFPLQVLRRSKSVAYITYGLIAINVLVFLWELTLQNRGVLGQTFYELALIPCNVRRSPFTVDTVVDSLRTMFLHGGWLHLLGNMLFLRLFGPAVEEYMGRVRFLLFYLAAGFAAGFAHTLFTTNCIPTIGASGAIFGVMGAFLLLYPGTRVRTVAFFFRIPVGTADVQAFYMLLYFFLVDVINGIGALGSPTVQTGGVAFWAHVGGFIAGVVMAFGSMLFRPPPPVDPLGYLDH